MTGRGGREVRHKLMLREHAIGTSIRAGKDTTRVPSVPPDGKNGGLVNTVLIGPWVVLALKRVRRHDKRYCLPPGLWFFP